VGSKFQHGGKIMSNLEARILKESEYNQWDQLVEQSEQGTIFHSSKWITTAAKNLNLDYTIIGVFTDSELIGGCFFYIKTIFHVFKIGYTGVPLTPFGGFVISQSRKKTKVRTSENREHEIISIILEKIQTFNLFIVKLTNSPALIDIRPLKQQGWIVGVYYSYILSLDNDIFLNVGKDVRRYVRLCQKNGIKAKKEYNPEILWGLIKLTYDKQNKNPPFQKEYLFYFTEMLIKNNLGEMYIAELPTGDAAAAVFVLFDGNGAHAWVGASDPQFRHTGVVSFIHFELITDLQRRGFQRINLMGGNVPQISKFFSNFNPKLVPYYSVVRIKGLGKIFNFYNRLLKNIWK
jgi:hypothetical protein